MKGIDISEWQENVNYLKLKSQGIDFAIIRCGYGKNKNQKDSKFEAHYRGLKYAGIKVGAYLYSYANTIEGAKAELENCLYFIKDKKFELPIFYDLENAGTTSLASKETITEMAKVFCDGLIKAGYKAGVYANLNWFKNKMNVKELEQYYIWLAQWGVVEHTADFKVDIWQYTSNGDIEGISTRVDLNKSYTQTFPQIVNKKSNEEIANEIIHGKWGNGQERKVRLTNAGYNYEEIQKIVNDRLLKNKKSNYDLATEVIQGLWGNGQDRKNRLTKAGYNYNEIQKIVNERLK